MHRPRRLLAVGACLLLAAASSGAQRGGPASPIHVRLAIASERRSFLSGEAIPLEISVTADQPDFWILDGVRPGRRDTLAIAPSSGVFRWVDRMPPQFSDTTTLLSLSKAPQLDRFALNEIVRFDAAGDYTISFTINRFGRGLDHFKLPGLAVTTNAVSFRVEMPTEAQERAMTDRAIERFDASAGQSHEIRANAARQLGFLPGDEAGLSKLRFLQMTPSERSSVVGEPLREGLFNLRRPQVVLDVLERQIRDVSLPTPLGVIADAADLRAVVDGSVPVKAAARYTEELRATLPRRAGTSLIRAAMEVLHGQSRNISPDIRRVIVDHFDEFPRQEREWFAGRLWSHIRSPKLKPSLLKMIDEGPPFGADDELRDVIELDPAAAIAPALRFTLDPERGIQDARTLAGLPSGWLKGHVLDLIRTIRALGEDSQPQSMHWNHSKSEILALAGDGSGTQETRAILRDLSAKIDDETRSNLNAYLVRWGRAEDATVVMLEPSELLFPEKIARFLSDRGCRIPQVWNDSKPHNMLAGRFLDPVRTDYAVLCSKNQSSSILIFKGASVDDVIEIARASDETYMQTVSPHGSRGYSRRISQLLNSDVTKYAARNRALTPLSIEHDGISDAFAGKASVVWYWVDGGWMRLQGAN